MSAFKNFDYRDFQSFIDGYRVFPESIKKPPTLMEIAGFPHWENVHSNILAFLLNSEEAHGFKQLVIRALMAAYVNYGKSCSACIPMKEFDPKTIQFTKNVEREAITKSNNRIDIIVECTDFVVCIENKIGAGLYNDLGDYRNHCENLIGGNSERVVGIVLSPQGVSDSKLGENHFVSITYGDLVDQIRLHMDEFIDSHDTKYHYLLFDFIEQSTRLTGVNSMDNNQREFLDFWKINHEKVNNMTTMCESVCNVLNTHGYAQFHIDECVKKLSESERKVFHTWVYKKSTAVFELAADVELDVLEVWFHPVQICHFLYQRKRRGVSPDDLISRISDKCKIDFDKSERPTSVINLSSFEDEARKKAVDRSVKILKAIHDITQDSRSTRLQSSK